jgi:hypothetical protein
MRRFVPFLLAILAVGSIFAQAAAPGVQGPPALGRSGLLGPEFAAIAKELGDRKLGDLTGTELAAIQEKLLLEARQRAYIARTARLSFVLPGLGQFATGNPGTGAAFLVGNLAIIGGTLAGAYFLLPADLRFDRIDYLSSSHQTIRTAWEAHTMREMMPMMGVMMAGLAIDLHLHAFSAFDAAKDARKLVDEGKADLKPFFGPGFMGMRYRY